MCTPDRNIAHDYGLRTAVACLNAMNAAVCAAGSPPGVPFSTCSPIFWMLRAELSKWYPSCGPIRPMDILVATGQCYSVVSTRPERLAALIAERVLKSWHPGRSWPGHITWPSLYSRTASLRIIGGEPVVLRTTIVGRVSTNFSAVDLVELSRHLPVRGIGVPLATLLVQSARRDMDAANRRAQRVRGGRFQIDVLGAGQRSDQHAHACRGRCRAGGLVRPRTLDSGPQPLDPRSSRARRRDPCRRLRRPRRFRRGA